MSKLLSISIIIYVSGIASIAGAYTIYNTVGDSAICSIAKVDDGDTFDLSCGSIYYPNVRLLGVNAPDMNIDAKKEHCFYQESKKYIEARIGRVYKVHFYGSDLCKDPYKGCRNLVQLIDIEGNFDVGKTMILKGFAFSWTNFSMIPDTIKYEYDRVEGNAYTTGGGLWGKCAVQFGDDSKIDSNLPDKMTL